MTTAVYAGISGWRRRIVVLLAAVIVSLVGIVLAVQGPASAHDHQVPKTVLMKGAKELQAGTKVVESYWVYPTSGGEFVAEGALYSWRFPEVDRVAAGSELHVRIHKSQRPDTFSVTTYPKVDQKGRPTGEGRLLRRTLEAVVRDGRTVAWDAVFYVHRQDRHYYLVTEGHWKDIQGSGDVQYAYWSFHVNTRGS